MSPSTTPAVATDNATEAEHESRQRDCWRVHAGVWTAAVRERRIGSRRITDRAMVAAALARQPRRALDLGCGEGWLARRLAAAGIDVLGVDAEPALIAAAQAGGGARFRVLDYAAIAAGERPERVDLIVCNFALFGADSVRRLLNALPAWLEPGGALLLQTLDPQTAVPTGEYHDGWRQGSWQGCGPGFGAAAPWYFRTRESWLQLLRDSGWHLRRLLRPCDRADGRVLSMLLEAVPSPHA